MDMVSISGTKCHEVRQGRPRGEAGGGGEDNQPRYMGANEGSVHVNYQVNSSCKITNA